MFNPENTDIKQMIRNKDVKGLYQALDSGDYETIKAAIIGLVDLNEFGFYDVEKSLFLLSDSDPRIRRIPYSCLRFGEFGFFANIAAIHDHDCSLREEGLTVLNEFHLPNALEIIKRSSQFDPDENIRRIAQSYYEKYLLVNSYQIIKTSTIPYPTNFGWFSYITLFEEYVCLLEQKHNNFDAWFKPGFPPIQPFSDFPEYRKNAMNRCLLGFKTALSLMRYDKDRGLGALQETMNHAVDILNYESANFSSDQTVPSGLPLSDFYVCGMVIAAKMFSSG